MGATREMTRLYNCRMDVSGSLLIRVLFVNKSGPGFANETPFLCLCLYKTGYAVPHCADDSHHYDDTCDPLLLTSSRRVIN